MNTLPGQLGHGMPPRDPIVELARTVKALRRQIDELQSTQQQVIQYVSGGSSGSVPNDNLPRPYASTNTITVPGNGLDRMSWLLSCEAGITFTASGTLYAAGIFNPLTGTLPLAHSISQGIVVDGSGNQTVSPTWLYSSTGWAAAAGGTFNFETYASFNGAASAGTGGCLTYAMVIWTRS